eukprot:gnl/TRDRNA2_/TRDRNA2_81588_c0_seq1.p1 gnl/TRDRNA2_/TRDRNA2_81588_c0~~gnl/TRDRNA2_/TRDRNA2_81588_c0_seq1.p1  ORF type:complete len:331 (-),score=48.46 gnl/TRDRNA2_/TRDRNA2_81588_c0_seq1:43-1035(-)
MCWPIRSQMMFLVLWALLATSSEAVARKSVHVAKDGECLRPSNAEDQEIEVYFGCGCFWHMQFEFAEMEKHSLNRGPGQITARTAYAGGQPNPDGMLCYHNLKGIAEYEKYGHAEVVVLTIPEGSFHNFTELFWKNCPGGNRIDQQDPGPAYRSVIGIPGGSSSPLATQFSAASYPAEVAFPAGEGSESDAKNTVVIYDSTKFTAIRAEKYHQFHDDMTQQYPQSYHDEIKFVKAGPCPGDAGYRLQEEAEAAKQTTSTHAPPPRSAEEAEATKQTTSTHAPPPRSAEEAEATKQTTSTHAPPPRSAGLCMAPTYALILSLVLALLPCWP